MVGGENIDLAPNYENEVGGDGGANHELVESGTKSPITNSRTKSNVFTTGEYINSLVNEKKIGVKLHNDMVKAEQRAKLLKTLSMLGVGTNDLEMLT